MSMRQLATTRWPALLGFWLLTVTAITASALAVQATPL